MVVELDQGNAVWHGSAVELYGHSVPQRGVVRLSNGVGELNGVRPAEVPHADGEGE